MNKSLLRSALAFALATAAFAAWAPPSRADDKKDEERKKKTEKDREE